MIPYNHHPAIVLKVAAFLLDAVYLSYGVDVAHCSRGIHSSLAIEEEYSSHHTYIVVFFGVAVGTDVYYSLC